MKYKKTLIVFLFVSTLNILYGINTNVQILKPIATPIKVDTVAKKEISEPINIPANDTVDIYKSFYNDDLMEGHPADDIYNNIWSSRSIKYKIPVKKLPDSFSVDCSDFKMPLDMSKGRISSRYGPRWRRFHHGIDIAIPRRSNIYSVFDGEVRIINYERRGFGHYVVIRHDNGLETVYAHLHKPLCKVNQRVKAGDVIGLSGNTGRSTGPHLHFETRFVGKSFNPAKMIDFKKQEVYAEHYVLKKGKDFYTKAERSMKRARYYRVRRGDCLGKIAQRYGTSVRRLKRLNRMRGTRIRIGQRIRVR